MCTRNKAITNKYTGKRIMCKCGHCHACQLEKANAHFNRIMNHEKDSRYFRLFITLNYANKFLPYIDMADDMMPDSEGNITMNVYRDASFRHYRNRYMRFSKLSVDDSSRQIIGSFSFNSKKYDDFSGLVVPQEFDSDTCVGVCWSKDFSDFIKRLKQNLLRFYNIDTSYGKLQYYKVSEYGPTTVRPHFHAILYFPIEYKKHYQQIKRTIISSWPLCSLVQLRKYVQVASSAQQYCALYDVRPSDYPDFLQIRAIAQKPSFTRNFGFGNCEFTAASILEKIRQHNIYYVAESCTKAGQPLLLNLSIPQYVISRYFPKFKGYYKLNREQIFSIYSLPLRLRAFGSFLGLSEDEIKNTVSKITLAQKRFGQFGFEYAWLWFRQMEIRASQSLITQMLQYNEERRFQSYDFVYSPVYKSLVDQDVNSYPVNILKDLEASEKWEKRSKKIKLNDYSVKLSFKYINVLSLKMSRYGKYFKKSSASCSSRL